MCFDIVLREIIPGWLGAAPGAYVGVKFEVASPQQVWRAGGDTFTSSTAGQVPNLSLDPASSQDVFWGADSPK